MSLSFCAPSNAVQMQAEETLWWSAGITVQIRCDGVRVGPVVLATAVADLVRKLDESLAEGATRDVLLASVDVRERGQARLLLDLLQRRGVVTAGPQGLHHLAWCQGSAFGSAGPLFTADAVDAYRHAAAHRSARQPDAEAVAVPFRVPSGALGSRRTCRDFDVTREVKFEALAHVLAVLAHQPGPDQFGRRAWPSAGGLYPIDCYVQVKPHRVAGVDGGVYLYDPVSQQLVPQADAPEWTSELHFFTNKAIAQDSAMSFLLVLDLSVVMGKYAGMGYPLGLLDAGIVAAYLALAAEEAGLGSCSIGDLNFEGADRALRLEAAQHVVHGIEMGYPKGGVL